MNSFALMPLQVSDSGRTVLSAVRLGLLYFVVLSPSLGTAVSAVGRFVLYLLAIAVLVFARRPSKQPASALMYNSAALTVLLAVAYMGMSLWWADASNTEALHAWARHARLLSIPIVYLMIFDYAEARSVLRVFVLGQVFVVFSAWLLVWGIPVPWATSKWAVTYYAVFGSYLEQSISQAVVVAILWYQRDWVFGANGRWWAIGIAATTLVLTLGFLIGRSGHLVALAIVMLALMHELPRRFRWMAVLVPFVVVAVVFSGFKTFRDRVDLVRTEITSFSDKADVTTSSGQRLMFWRVAVQAIREQPVIGHGVGSWNKEYRRLQAGRADPTTLSATDPHQLFFLWAVEGGLVGFLLLCAVLGELYVRSRKLLLNDARTLQSIIVALIVSGMLNSMIFGIGMGDFFCVALGLCMALVHGTQAMQEQTNHG